MKSLLGWRLIQLASPIDCKIRHDSFNCLSVRDDSEHPFNRARHIDTANRMARLLAYEDTFEMQVLLDCIMMGDLIFSLTINPHGLGFDYRPKWVGSMLKIILNGTFFVLPRYLQFQKTTVGAYARTKYDTFIIRTCNICERSSYCCLGLSRSNSDRVIQGDH